MDLLLLLALRCTKDECYGEYPADIDVQVSKNRSNSSFVIHSAQVLCMRQRKSRSHNDEENKSKLDGMNPVCIAFKLLLLLSVPSLSFEFNSNWLIKKLFYMHIPHHYSRIEKKTTTNDNNKSFLSSRPCNVISQHKQGQQQNQTRQTKGIRVK